MDINQKLDDIIFRYGLDACYPNYRPCQKAQAIVRQIIAGWSPDERIACVVTDKDDQHFFEMSMTEDKNVDFYVCKRKIGNKAYLTRYLLDESLGGLLGKFYDKVYAISIDGLIWVESWLRAHDVAFISLYQEFERQGIFLDAPYRDFLYDKFGNCLGGLGGEHAAAVTMETVNVRNRALAADDDAIKALELRKLFFLALVSRDFLLAKESLRDLQATGFHGYDDAWQDIGRLLSEIRDALEAKAKETVFAFWVDCTSYYALPVFPRLTKILEQGVHFENLFSATPFTHPTSKAIFCQKKNIDDEGYKIKHIDHANSPMLRMLEEKGYTFKVISEYLGDMFSGRYKTGIATKAMSPSSMLIWESMAEALRSEGKRFILMHCVQETHGSAFRANPKIPDKKLDFGAKLALLDYAYFMLSGYAYLDQQIGYYESLLPKSAMKIFFSDHGDLPNLKDRTHIFMGIVGEGIPSLAIQRMYSTLDFKDIFAMALEKDYAMDKIDHEYIEFQDFPVYSGKEVANTIRNNQGINQLFLGYRGVVTKEYFYARLGTDIEYLEHRNDSAELPPYRVNNPNDPHVISMFHSHICDESLLPTFRKWAKTENYNPLQITKTKFSQYYLKIYENLRNRVNRVSALMNQLVAESPAPIALRMGGLHTAFIIDELTEENKNRIGAILDPSPDCLCSKYGYPVISPADFIAKKAGTEIQTVILSSFAHRGLLVTEAKTYHDVSVIDFYDWMEAHGISAEADLTGYTPAKEDFDVNFPFDEVE